MKRVILILGLVLDSNLFAQESKFSEGFNPDGKIGNLSMTFLTGFTNLKYGFDNYINTSTKFGFKSELAFPMDRNATLLIQTDYMNLTEGSYKYKIWSFGAGIRVFGGMSRK